MWRSSIRLIPERYHNATKVIISKLPFTIYLAIEMKSDADPEIGRCPNIRAPSKKADFSKQLVGVLRDIEDNQSWKYDELPPVQLLERLKLNKCLADRGEVERAEYFWTRRPRFLRAIGWILWFLVALGLPFWLFDVPAIGLPLFLLAAVVANTDIVRSVRWRRQYELSIDRLVRTTRNFPRSEESQAI
jgi:hypothetical protein